jgi:hypothetical protein
MLEAGRLPETYWLSEGDGMSIEAPVSVADAIESRVADRERPAAWVPALFGLERPGDYIAILAYLHHTPQRDERLQRLRVACRAATRLATTLGYGPRFLHSTGQLHKGGPNSGIFLQLTADEGPEVPIPGERYDFGALIRAQAAGRLRSAGAPPPPRAARAPRPRRREGARRAGRSGGVGAGVTPAQTMLGSSRFFTNSANAFKASSI